MKKMKLTREQEKQAKQKEGKKRKILSNQFKRRRKIRNHKNEDEFANENVENCLNLYEFKFKFQIFITSYKLCMTKCKGNSAKKNVLSFAWLA